MFITVVLCCIVRGVPSNEALISKDLGCAFKFYPTETSAAYEL